MIERDDGGTESGGKSKVEIRVGDTGRLSGGERR